MTTSDFGDEPIYYGERRKAREDRRIQQPRGMRWLSEKRSGLDRREGELRGPSLSDLPARVGEARVDTAIVEECWQAGFVWGMCAMLLMASLAFIAALLVDGTGGMR